MSCRTCQYELFSTPINTTQNTAAFTELIPLFQHHVSLPPAPRGVHPWPGLLQCIEWSSCGWRPNGSRAAGVRRGLRKGAEEGRLRDEVVEEVSDQGVNAQLV